MDNIPGVPGVGEKTAVALLRQFHDLDQLLIRVAEVDRPKLRASLVEHTDRIRLNQRLIRLHQNVAVQSTWESLEVPSPDYPALLTAMKRHGFQSLVTEIQLEAQQGGDLFAHF